MHKFPLWLPDEVRLHTESLIEKGGLNDLKPLLMRLDTYPEMEKVWRKLSSSTDDPQKLIDFMEYVRLHPALQGNNTDPIEIPSDNTQRKSFKRVGDLSKRLTKEIRDLSLANKAYEGWALLESALSRAELHAADHISQDDTAKAALLEIKSIQNRLDNLEQHEPIISILDLIRSAAHYASTATDTTLPKRRNTESAKKNQLILDLKQYLKHHFNTESPSIIAAIVNTAFESADGGVTADDDRKLNLNGS